MPPILLSVFLLILSVIFIFLAVVLVNVTGPRPFIILIAIAIVLFITAIVVLVLPGVGAKEVFSVVPSSSNVEALDFLKGKRLERNLSIIFLIGGVVLVFSMLSTDKSILPILAKLILSSLFGGIAFLAYSNIKKINTLASNRQQIYTNGTPVTAKVIDHSKKFVFYASSPAHGITVKTNEAQQKTITFFYANKKLHNSCHKGDTIKGFKYKGDYFFGEMIGVKLDFTDEKGKMKVKD